MQYNIYSSQTEGKFGFSQCFDKDSQTLFISDPLYNGNRIPKVYAYKFDQSSEEWRKLNEFYPTNLEEVNSSFGNKILCNNNGDLLFISSKTLNQFSINQKETIYVFKKDLLGWTEFAKINPIDSRFSNFGELFTINASGNILAVSCKNQLLNSREEIHIYELAPGGFSLRERLYDNFKQNVIYNDISLNKNGNILIASCNTNNMNKGEVYVYKLNNNQFSETQRLSLENISENTYFGEAISINDLGDKVLISSKLDNYIYVFSDTNGLYFLDYKIRLSDNKVNVKKLSFSKQETNISVVLNDKILFYELNQKNDYVKRNEYYLDLRKKFEVFINKNNEDFSVGYYEHNSNGKVEVNQFNFNPTIFLGTNERNPSINLKLEALPYRLYEEVVLSNPQVTAWASYKLDPISISGSGSFPINFNKINAFDIDFERYESGVFNIPSLFYKEYSGEYDFLCGVIKEKPICTEEICLICSEGFKLIGSGLDSINVPKSYKIRRDYRDVFEFLPGIPNFDRILLDTKFKDFCCSCECDTLMLEKGVGEEDQEDFTIRQKRVEEGLLFSGLDSIFFADTELIDYIKPKYGLNMYSGQIEFNNFTEGDKIKFQQYQYDYIKIHRVLYNRLPLYPEVKEIFTYSNTLSGDNYFKSKLELIEKINNKLSDASYTWIPLKQYPSPKYYYNGLLEASDGGFDISGRNLINIKSLNPGKLGHYKIDLDLGPKLELRSYLVPQTLSLQGSNDGINWETIVSSKDVQPVNVYLKDRTSKGPNIKYDEIENTKYTYVKEVPIGSESETLPNKPPKPTGSLSGLLSGIKSGNEECFRAIFVDKTITCVPSPNSSGKCCGEGFYDLSIFSCKSGEKEEEDGEDGDDGEEEGDPEKEEPTIKVPVEVNRFRLGFWDYLKNLENFDLSPDLINPNPEIFAPNQSSSSSFGLSFINQKNIPAYPNKFTSFWPPVYFDDRSSSSFSFNVNNSICEQSGYFSIPYIDCPSGYNSKTITIQNQICYDCEIKK